MGGIEDLIGFVRARMLGVVATSADDGDPEAALVGIAVTDRGELVFDTSRDSRKFVNLTARPGVAIVVGWDDEVTLQVEGDADVPTGDDRERCLAAYFSRFPDGRDRAEQADIVHVRVRPRWARIADFRPDTFGVTELTLE